MDFKMKEEVGFFAELPYGRLDIAGDDEYGYRPFQLLVASLAVCSGGVLRKIMKKMRMSFEDIQIKTSVERNPDIADRVEKVHIHFLIKGTDLNEAKLHKAMELTRKNCSMVRSVEDSIEVVETFEIV
ncbi:OsmC family protein [Bacillus sp. ISL-47]|uniref:OsmC family protein n=1 Tax=Bacillus sp. ISL-47 TaxID=2819130 RepID=UPI001BE8F3FC|nr:OsmC family protein [Bacillus sp. ISL-47]MBT2688479.1 OsmC family protein [Bacillus sp. ISL-47]MBT2709058.1 OsmC family protein [Pseudomonas sp. ISL-84]